MTAGQLLKWLIIIFVGLWVVWLFTGGPQRQTSQGGIFIKPLESPVNTIWRSYGKNFSLTTEGDSNEIREDLEKAQELAGKSLYTDKIILGRGNASYEKIDGEYLTIEASQNNTNRINITGWIVESIMSGKKITIGKGTYLPYTSKVNTQEPIFLSPGEKVYITTGRSPVGTSFRTNLCTGYFEQFQNFNPSLIRECPESEDEENFIIFGPNALNDQCIDFVEAIPKCEINTRQIPIDMQYECSSYIASDINYNTCVAKHKNEPNFYKPEWRVFLNRDDILWKSRRETIKLSDGNGNLVDTVTY